MQQYNLVDHRASNGANPDATERSSENGDDHELNSPPWIRVESTLMATARAIRQAYDHALAPFDLNLNMASSLAYLAMFGPMTQTVLAERLSIGRAAAGTYIDRLEKRNLVERRADADDRRVWLVSPTETGVELAEKVALIDEQIRTQLRTGIDHTERQALADLLVRLQKNVCPLVSPEREITQ